MFVFTEIALQPTYPILHSKRRDGATLTAIRVPIDDVRLEQWGWILTLSHKSKVNTQDDIATLQDNSGQQYPKVYTQNEILQYIEKWGCEGWEVGYDGDGNIIHSTRITKPLSIDTLQKEMLQETLVDIRLYQEEQTKVFNEEIALQNQLIAASTFNQLSPQFTSIFGKQNQLFTFCEELKNQLDTISERFTNITNHSVEEAQDQYSSLKTEIGTLLNQISAVLAQEVTPKLNDVVNDTSVKLDAISEKLTKLTEQATDETRNQYNALKIEIEALSSQMPINVEQVVVPKLNEVVSNTNTQLDAMDQELKLQLSQIQSKTVETVEEHLVSHVERSQRQLEELDQAIREKSIQGYNSLMEELRDHFQMIDSDNQRQFEVIDKEIKSSFEHQADQIKFLQDQIKKVLELTDITSADTNGAESEDFVETVNRIAKQPTTRIARIAARQLTTGNRYYDNVNEQSKRSFELARRLSYIGGIIFIVTIASVIFAEAFHITHDPNLLPLGVITTAITELMAGLNFLYDRATKQFSHFHIFLDRIIRSSIAHAMSEDIKDPARKQEIIEKIVNELLENDNRIKE